MQVSIKNFIAKVTFYLKLASEGGEITITKHGKPYAKVITLEGESYNNSTESYNNVSKAKTLNDLRQKTTDIKGNEAEKVITSRYCEACKKERLCVPAVSQEEVITSDSIEKHWLCEKHKQLSTQETAQVRF